MKRLLFVLAIALAVLYPLDIFAEVMVLFDEDADTEAGNGKFTSLFVSHDAGSVVEVTEDQVFAGSVSVFATPAQSYNNNMAGWSFPIRENPGNGEYRYIFFAWKANGGSGVMIQFPDNGGWGAVTKACIDPPAIGTRRYIAGTNVTGWSGVCVADDIPEEWTVVQRDLFADFGEFVMTGMALTPFSDGGDGDYYDAIMLASDENEFPNLLAVSADAKVAITWGDLKSR